MICIDIGSGYNPKEGYLTCDTEYGCDYYSIDEIPDNFVDVFHMRNVLHHVKDLNTCIKKILTKCKNDAIVDVIDCSEEYFYQNFFLDNLWYRYVNKRPDIYISPKYRDFINIFTNNGFLLLEQKIHEEKLILKFKYINIMEESIKKQLEENGYDFAVAVATQSEIENGAACGQLSIITD